VCLYFRTINGFERVKREHPQWDLDGHLLWRMFQEHRSDQKSFEAAFELIATRPNASEIEKYRVSQIYHRKLAGGEDRPIRHYKFAELFTPEPDQWGLRGDPFLWRALARSLGHTSLPSTQAELVATIEVGFEKMTGLPLPDEPSDESSIYVKRFGHGGMSSGQISLSFWRRFAIPLLCARFKSVGHSA